MRSPLYPTFLLALGATLTLGSLLQSGRTSLAAMLLCPAFYWAALLLQSYADGDLLFHKAESLCTEKEDRLEILFAGSFETAPPKRLDEMDYLTHADGRRTRAGLAVASVAFVWLMVDFRFGLALPFSALVIAALLVSSTSLAHFLIPLGVQSLLILHSLGDWDGYSARDASWVVYAALLLCTLVLFQIVQRHLRFGSAESEPTHFEPRHAVAAAGPLACLAIVFVCANPIVVWVLSSKQKDRPVAEPAALRGGAVLDVGRLVSGAGGSAQPSEDGSGGGPGAGTGGDGTATAQPRRAGESTDAGGGESSAREDGRASAEPHGEDSGSGDAAEQRGSEGRDRSSSADGNRTGAAADGGGGSGGRKGGGAGASAGDDGGRAAGGSGGQGSRDSRPGPRDADRVGASAQARAGDPPRLKRPWPELTLNAKTWVYRVIAFAALVGLIAGIRTLRKTAAESKADEKPPRPETRDELLERLRSASAETAILRDQIVYKYRIFLEIMSSARVPKEDYLPPTDYSRRLSGLYPEEAQAFDDISTLFCRAFYGQHPVRPEDLARFDRALEQVLRRFETA